MASVLSAGTTSNTALNLSADTTGILQFQTNGTTAAMTIDTSQNVGIGTTSPSFFAGGGLQVSNATQANLRLSDTTNAAYNFDLFMNDADAYAVNRTSGPIVFGTNNTERMRITSGGNVGIGTSSPAFPLDVRAATSVISAVSTTGTNSAYMYVSNTGGDFYLGRDNSAGTTFGTGTGYSAVLYSAGAYPMVFFTNAAERMRIDSSGNVGIGNTPSGTSATGYRSLELGTTAGTGITAGNGDFYVPVNAYVASGAWKYATTSTASLLNIQGGLFTWSNAVSGTAGNNISFSERMRIDSGGNVLVGASSAGMVNGGIQSQPNGNTTNVPFFGCAGNSSSSSHLSYGLYSTSLSQYQFYVDYNGTISARSTSITGLSDISEKENIQPLETGLNEVLALQPRRFDWKNGSGQNIAGFVAQEVETVLPDLVADYKVDEKTTKKGLKMGDMIPTLVKAIQELKAELDATKAEVAALKGVK